MSRPSVFSRIVALLREAEAPFRELRHDPVRTAVEAARVRGTPLRAGGKSLVMKMDDRFEILVTSAATRLTSSEARRAAGARRSRFATADELRDLTDCVPGSVPPFGRPVFDLPLRAHRSILAEPEIAFTPGVLDASIVMATADWVRVARPAAFPAT